MSAAVDIYVPTQWNTTVASVLTAAGFHVTARDRKLPDGTPGRDYSCTRDRETITLTETPHTKDSHTWSLDSDAYHRQSRNA